MASEQIKMQLSKTTKNTDVYVPVQGSKAPPVTTLYVSKWFTEGAQNITVVVATE